MNQTFIFMKKGEDCFYASHFIVFRPASHRDFASLQIAIKAYLWTTLSGLLLVLPVLPKHGPSPPLLIAASFEVCSMNGHVVD